MGARLDAINSTVVAAAAVVIAVVYATGGHRDRSGASAEKPGAPTYMKDWTDLSARGSIIGDPDAPVKLAEFADFQCPYCREFHKQFDAIHAEFGNRIALVYIHFPLPIHRLANEAAQAAECAAAQGLFAQYAGRLYENQDSIGKRSWSAFARDASVPDSAKFEECLKSESSHRIRENTELGTRLGVRGTPTIIVNGWVFHGLPDSVELKRVIRDLLANREPYKRHWWGS